MGYFSMEEIRYRSFFIVDFGFYSGYSLGMKNNHVVIFEKKKLKEFRIKIMNNGTFRLSM